MAVLGEAGHGAQPVRPGGEDAGRGAEHVEQSAGEMLPASLDGAMP